jgi:hypothetical protein
MHGGGNTDELREREGRDYRVAERIETVVN